MLKAAVSVTKFIGAGVLAALLLATPALARDEAAEAWVQSLADRATGILSNPDIDEETIVTEFQTLLTEHAALRSFGRSALGAYQRVATEEEFEQYIELLEQYATSVIRSRFTEYSNQTMSVTGSTIDARANFDYISVESDILDVEGERLAGVRWILIHRNGEYRVYNIVVETPAETGTFSLLQTQQEEFNSIITGNGGRISALLRYLRNKIREAGMEPANERQPN